MSRVSQCFLFLIFPLLLQACSSGSSPSLATIPAENTSSENGPGEEAPPPEPLPAPPEEVAELPPLPSGDLGKENIGSKARVSGLFDRWTLKSSITGGRGSTFAEVSVECHGRVEVDLALTPEQWKNADFRQKYYQAVHQLIDKNATQLLVDMGNPFGENERLVFLRAVKALAWQESRWQHFLRYKDWFFIFLSGGSYNVLDDWGITQVARSGFKASDLLNADFFKRRDHCSLSRTIYYGFMEYFQNYMEARSLSCNRNGEELDKIVGAYNRYSSGFSACRNGFSTDSAYRDYQVRAMNGFKGHYLNAPWESVIR